MRAATALPSGEAHCSAPGRLDARQDEAANELMIAFIRAA